MLRRPLRRGTTAALDNAEVFIDYQVSRDLSLSVSNRVSQRVIFTFRGSTMSMLRPPYTLAVKRRAGHLWATIVATETTFVAVAAQSACRVNVKVVLYFISSGLSKQTRQSYTLCLPSGLLTHICLSRHHHGTGLGHHSAVAEQPSSSKRVVGTAVRTGIREVSVAVLPVRAAR